MLGTSKSPNANSLARSSLAHTLLVTWENVSGQINRNTKARLGEMQRLNMVGGFIGDSKIYRKGTPKTHKYSLKFNIKKPSRDKSDGLFYKNNRKVVYVNGYTANELPQPQVLEALGLVNTKPLASRPVLQSISIPTRYIP